MKTACSAVLLALMLSGCGYRTAGKAVRIPADVKTIAIPTFTNQTQTYKIEQTLTSSVIREFHGRTRFQIVQEESAPAEALLRGTVVSTTLAPLTYDAQSGRASSALVTVTMKVSLTDPQGRVMFENPNYIFREQYQVSREISSFFEEEGPALERLARDFAQRLVSDILEAY
jgi:outer membrane lipopolysaccharide assembly protein LptE/RlpB